MASTINTLLSPSLILLTIALAGQMIYSAYESNREADEEMKQMLTRTAASAPNSNRQLTNIDRPLIARGLMGQTKTQAVDEKPKKTSAIRIGPKTLEGLFIQGGEAWAVVTNYQGESEVIPPSSVKSYNARGVIIHTKQGPKSLHFTLDSSGIHISKWRPPTEINRKTPLQQKSKASKTFEALLKRKIE